MKHSLHVLAVLALTGIATGCAGRKIAHDQVDTVKKVAIVGFGVEQRVPNTAEGVLSDMMAPKDNSFMSGAKAAKIAEPAPHARIMYDLLQDQLAKGMGWKVIAREDLTRRSDYAAFFHDKTKQPQMRPFVSGPNMEMYVPEGVVESFLIHSMSIEERRALIKKLGVDAVALVTVRIELENGGGLKTLVGAGDLHPRAKVSFELYNSTAEDPIWMDLNADGDASAEGVEHVLGFANVDAVNKQAIATADSAFHQLIKNYKE
jgi:hypothetical protein